MLNSLKIMVLAERLNKKINLPVIGEKVEFAIMLGAVVLIDHTLQTELNFDLALYLESDASISQERWDEISGQAAEFLNEKINVPVISEGTEAKLLQAIIFEIGQFVTAKISL